MAPNAKRAGDLAASNAARLARGTLEVSSAPDEGDEAEDGAQAVRLANELKPDVILMNLQWLSQLAHRSGDGGAAGVGAA